MDRFLKIFHGAMLVGAIVVWILAVRFGWINSVVFVSHLSVVAIVYEATNAWMMSRIGKRQAEGEENGSSH